jgi:Low-density lipoprotein receptor domain class A
MFNVVIDVLVFFILSHFICFPPHSYLKTKNHVKKVGKTTIKPNLKSLDNTLHSRTFTTKNCKDNEFQCESDGVCIAGYKVCNNYRDCSDHSDEKYCDDVDDGDYGNAPHCSFVLHSCNLKAFL